MLLSPRRIVTTALLSLIYVYGSLAQAVEEETATIQVTATRTAQTADASQQSVTVITREDIEASPAQTVDEMLRTVPGVDISRDGGYGKSTSIFLRGTGSDHALVLVDGVRAASATLGSFAWSNFSLENIERIEVVRGPRAALYGSDAIGGVIQIFTRKEDRTSLKLTGGSHNTREANVTTAWGEAWRYHFEAGRSITDGIPTRTSETDDHGYTNSHASFAMEGNLSAANRLNLRFQHNDGFNERAASTGDNRYTNQVASAKLLHTASANWTQQYQLGYTLDRSHSFSPSIPAVYETRRYSGSWQNDVDWSAGLTTVGIDVWQDNATKDNSGKIDAQIDNSALFLQHQAKPTAYGTVSASARIDDHSKFGTHETWDLGWSKQVDNLRYLASYGTAFKAPTVNDLYWPNSTSTYTVNGTTTTYITEGNPDLEPEESETLELGFRHKVSRDSHYEVNLYETKLENLIDWQTTTTGPSTKTITPSNVDRVTIRGLELIGASRLSPHWSLSGSFTLLSAKNDDTGVQLDNRPREKVKLSALWQKTDKRLKIELLGATTRKDRGGEVELDGYHIFNLNYQWDYSKQATGRIRVENLFDKEYILATTSSGDYSTIGRSMFIDFIYYFDK